MRKRAQLRSKPTVEEPKHVAMKIKPKEEEKPKLHKFKKNWWIAVSLTGIFLLVLSLNTFYNSSPEVSYDPDAEGFRFTKKPELILPDVHLATILVLESRKKTATAVVISSEEDFPVGSPIIGLSWSGEPEILSKIATCTLE